MQVKIKICGISEEDNIRCCIDNSTDMIGFVFYQNSPRNISIAKAKNLYREFGCQINIVGLVVDPEESLIDTLVNEIGINIIQFHGNEDIDKLLTLKSKYNIQIIKAININKSTDKARLDRLQNNMDYLLFDAPPPEDATRPGGNGNHFDWSLIKNSKMDPNWILSGGLSPENISDAIKITGANFVDVSSGVENDVGMKDNDLITKFIYNARNYMEKN
jgi:phosphoribosylanthranilate isomerase